MSLFVNDEFICASYPIYGTVPGVPGNEKGHLIEVTRCVDDGSAGGYPGHAASSYRNHSLSVKVGDKVRVMKNDLYSQHHYCTQQQQQKRGLEVEGPDVAEAVRLGAVPSAGPVVAQRQR